MGRVVGEGGRRTGGAGGGTHSTAARDPGEALRLLSGSAARTRALGRRLGACCRGGEVLLLRGDLGAGKTTLTQGIAAGLGVRVPVNSPTFIVLREYEGRLPLYHFDFYRLEGTPRAEDLGVEFEGYLEAGGVCVIEWPSYAASFLPEEHLSITLNVQGARERELCLEARGVAAARLLACLDERGGR